MSVINQMLKDLDKRNPETEQQQSAVAPAVAKSSAMKITLIVLTIVLLLNGVAFYIWQLMSENEALRNAKLSQANEAAMMPPSHEQVTLAQISKQPRPRNSATLPTAPLKQSDHHNVNEDASEIAQLAVKPQKNRQAEPNKRDTVRNSSGERLTKIPVKLQPTQLVQASSIAATKLPPSSQSAQTVVAPKDVGVKLSETANSSPEAAQVTQEPKPTPSMSISRRQLTASELVEQKMSQAQTYLSTKNIIKAEQLFEEVLIIAPSNKQARLKLSALWYGRKAYQKALNLLSQGIAIAPQNSDFRKMKAQILTKEKQYAAAYETLKVLAETEQEEYQVLLAGAAQESGNFAAAINSYQMLIRRQPDSGRWHLGLAIVYDKNSQFTLAIDSYRQALTKNDLSRASANFAQQRVQALGQ